jgi:hypothetical protein
MHIPEQLLPASFHFIYPWILSEKKVHVSLLSRDIAVPMYLMRDQQGLYEEDTIVFFNSHCLIDSLGTDVSKRLSRESVQLIMPSAFALRHSQILPLPAHETESQNWIKMCDCVVTRCGYSTVSEAVLANVPLVFRERPDFIEDETITSHIRRIGVGKSYVYEQIRSLDWIAEFPELPRYKQHYVYIDPNYTNSGSKDSLSCLQEFIA